MRECQKLSNIQYNGQKLSNIQYNGQVTIRYLLLLFHFSFTFFGNVLQGYFKLTIRTKQYLFQHFFLMPEIHLYG